MSFYKSLALGAVALVPVWATGQDTVPDPGEEDVFVLPEFVVSGEDQRGYTATNSLTGTFLDTPLKDTPFAIDVFMPDLIADTGSTDMREILAYDSGLQLENTIAAQGDGAYTLGTEFDSRGINNAETDIVTRGFRAPTLKNGFFTKTRVDTVNIARVERAGGPQSLLYGIGSISGITNVITKRPLSEPRYSTELFAGTNDFYRATVEATGPILRKDAYELGYITSLAFQTEGTDFPHEETTTSFIAPAVSFRGWDATTVYLSVEYGWREDVGTGAKDAGDPRGGVVNEKTGINSGQRITGDSATFLEDYLGMGHYVNLGGPDAYQEDDVLNINFELTQRIGENFRLLVAFNRDEQNRDEVFYARSPFLQPVQIPGTNPPQFVTDPETGEFAQELSYAFGKSYEDRVTEQARVALLASFEFFGGQHSFVAGRQEFSQYLTGLEFPDQVNQDNYPGGRLPVWPADGSSIRDRGDPYVQPTRENRQQEWYQGNYLLYQGSLWNGRVTPVLGYRWDRSMTRFLQYDFESGEIIDPLEDRNTVNGYSNRGEPFRQETPTLGLSVALTDNLSVYGTYAEGIALANVAQRDGYGEGFAPEFTRSREAGMKVSFWGGRISGRLTYFELEKRGGVRYTFYAPAPYRGNFDPDAPITAAVGVGTPSAPKDLRPFLEFLGIYDPSTGDFLYPPNELPRTTVVRDGNNTFVVFDYGEVGNPGSYDPVTNTAPNGYGQDLIDFIAAQREILGGETSNSPQYMWSKLGNHPGEDRGAYHTFDEFSHGYEVRLQITPVDNWQMILSYTYNIVEISSGLSGLADILPVTGLEPWYWYMDPADFGESGLPSTYNGAVSKGVRNTDVPVHSASFWTKYEFTEGPLEGFDIRFGARYKSERAAESPWSNNGSFVNAPQRGVGDDVQAPVPGHTLYDLGFGYKWRWRDLDWRLNVNIRNLFDKDLLSATSSGDSPNTTVAGQPKETRFYLDGRDIRLSLRVDF